MQVHESHDVGKTVGYVQTNLKRGTGQSLSRGLDNLTHMQQYVEPIYVYRKRPWASGFGAGLTDLQTERFSGIFHFVKNLIILIL